VEPVVDHRSRRTARDQPVGEFPPGLLDGRSIERSGVDEVPAGVVHQRFA
jgi:hypothetical protein